MLTLRVVELKDMVPLAETLHTGFQHITRETWLRRFENWWTLNPAFSSEFPRGWLLEEEAKIVGFIGNIPVKYEVHGELKIAAAAYPWYVDPSLRGLASIQLFNEYVNQKNVSVFLFGTTNKDLLKFIHRYGFKEYSCLPQGYEYIYITNWLQFLRQINLRSDLFQYIRRKEINNLKDLSRFIIRSSKFIYLHHSQNSSNRIGERSDGMYTSSLCTYCDDAFSRLWDPLLNYFNIAMSRDRTTLNWLYFTAGNCNNRKVIQCRRSSDDTLVGYVVFDFISWKGGSIMKLMDICIKDDDQQIFASLILYAIEVGKQNKTSIILLWANNRDIEAFLRKKNMIKWPAEYFTYIKFSEELERDSDALNIHLGMICLPRGIDHLSFTDEL